MTWWWTPDALVEEFRGTQYEFQIILLPDPTAECRAARINSEDRCSRDPVVRRGKKLGACDDNAHALQTVVASSLRDLTYETPEVDRSPGYHAILNLKISQLDMNIMLQKWVAGGRTGYAGRAAVCEWVIEHQDNLRGHIPRGYPRVFAPNTSYDAPQMLVGTALGGFAILYVLLAGVLVCRYRSAKVFVYAQVPFVYMVLLGMLFGATGSILIAGEPQGSKCIGENWFITLGYTLELVPLLVKIAAINHVLNASRQMKQVRIDMKSLFLRVFGIVMVIAFLTTWTTVDPAQRREGRYLKEDGDIMEVTTTIVCASESTLWGLAVLCWNGILVLCATVLAFQSQKVKQEFNDCKSLGTMIYSHFMFATLRVVVFGVSAGQLSVDEGGGIGSPTIDPSILATTKSILLSLDVITAVTIYVVPKLLAARESPDAYTPTETLVPSTMNNTRGVPTNSKPGIDDSHETAKRGPFSRARSADTSSGSSCKRIGMDGNVNETTLSEAEDWGGPRFTTVP